MSEQNSAQIQAEKKTFTFGFSKTKPKVTLSQNEKAFQTENNNKTDIELIKSIEGKKVNTVNKSAEDEKKKPLIIPCAKNNLIFDIKREEIRNKKLEDNEAKLVTTYMTRETLISTGQIDDLAAINALIADSKKKVEDKEKNDIQIPLNEAESNAVEDPDYESIDLEKFGLAALRGMGWSEKNGMGLTNKRSIPVYEPELRPKGLGLGAGSSKKSRPGESDDSRNGQESNTNLKYVKGAYVKILNGKHMDEYGQIVSFDDGLNRVIVKLASDDSTISLIQNYTKLLSKSEFLERSGKGGQRN